MSHQAQKVSHKAQKVSHRRDIYNNITFIINNNNKNKGAARVGYPLNQSLLFVFLEFVDGQICWALKNYMPHKFTKTSIQIFMLKFLRHALDLTKASQRCMRKEIWSG